MNINKFGQRSHITWTAEDLRNEREAEKEIQMREIKFRGKRKDNNEWVYGYYVKVMDREGEEIDLICSIDTSYPRISGKWYLEDTTEVIPETVGQQIGRQDKNKKEIYKGDIVKVMIEKAHYAGEKDKYRQEIATSGCSCGLNTNGMISIKEEGQEEYKSQLEIIGNIHQNPELMEQGNG